MHAVAGAAAAVVVGTLAGSGRPALALPLAISAIVLLAASLLFERRRLVALVVALVALGSGSGASAAFRTLAAERALIPPLAVRGTVIEACGTIRDVRPRSIEILADEVMIRARSWRTREPLRVAGPTTGDVRSATPSGYEGVTRRSEGERVCARGPTKPGRPGRDEPPIVFAQKIVRKDGGSAVRLAASAIRRRYSEVARRALPETQAGLLLGMTDGDTELLDDRTIEAFRTTGLAHLVAVSGQNVALLLAVVLLVSRALVRRGRWIRSLIAFPPLVFFVFLTGLEPSVMRAVITGGIALTVAAEGRTTDAARVSLLALIVLVLVSPEALFSLGFQLSFAATFGLILWAGPLAERFSRRLPGGTIGNALSLGAAATVAAQAAVAPFLAWRFGRVPALGGIANLVCVPLAPLITVGGLITLSAGSVFSFLGFAPALLRAPLDLILGCAQWFAHLPLASVGASLLTAAAVTAGLAAVLARSKRMRAATCALAVVAASAAAGQARAVARCDGPEVTALDVGQGTAILLRDGDRAILVDGGPDTGGVVSDLALRGVRRLDAAFVTHPHFDHTSGIALALRKIDVGGVLAPVTIGWGWGGQVVREAAAAHVPLRHVAQGDSFRFGTISVDVLWPLPGPAPPESDELIHPWGLVLRARIAGTTVVLPGDLGAREEAKVAGEDVEAPILIAPHHGSKDIDPSFVGAVSPKVTLVGVGVDNPYGHPTVEALRRYARYGEVYRTDKHGTIVVCLAHGAAEVTTEK